MTRCPSNDQQTLFFEERITGLLKIEKPNEYPNVIWSIKLLGFLKQDSPPHHFEINKQKGKSVFCTAFSIHSNHFKNIGSNTKEIMSFQDQTEKGKSITM